MEVFQNPDVSMVGRPSFFDIKEHCDITVQRRNVLISRRRSEHHLSFLQTDLSAPMHHKPVKNFYDHLHVIFSVSKKVSVICMKKFPDQIIEHLRFCIEPPKVKNLSRCPKGLYDTYVTTRELIRQKNRKIDRKKSRSRNISLLYAIINIYQQIFCLRTIHWMQPELSYPGAIP